MFQRVEPLLEVITTPLYSLLLSFPCSDSHFFPVLQTHLCICCPFTDLSIHSSIIHPSTHPSTTHLPPIYPFIHPLSPTHISPPIHSSFYFLSSTHLSIHPSIYHCIYLLVNSLPFQVSTIIYPSIPIPICLLTYHPSFLEKNTTNRHSLASLSHKPSTYYNWQLYSIPDSESYTQHEAWRI